MPPREITGGRGKEKARKRMGKMEGALLGERL